MSLKGDQSRAGSAHVVFGKGNVMRRLFVLAALLVALAAATSAALVMPGEASAESSGVTPTREPISVDFTIPDVCTFPIRVHTEGWMITTPTGIALKTVATLSNESLTRSLTQQNLSVLRFGDSPTVYWQVLQEKIVLPGSGLVYGSMGRLVFYFDDEGNVLGSEFHGRQDPYSQYTTVVCGYLSE